MSQLTLTLDDDLLQAAQNYAQQQGQKLETIVAELLKATVRPSVTPPARPLSPLVQELYGSVSLPADFDYRTAIAEAIQEKHGR
jgi:hypothetical protein